MHARAKRATARSQPQDVVIVSSAELKALTQLREGPRAAATRSLSFSGSGALSHRSAERKKRILDIDAKAKRDPQSLEEQAHERQQAEMLLGRAKQATDEEHEDVKRMNQLVQYAKTVAVRDQQRAEKERIAAEIAEEQRRLDMAMEVERVKALKALEESERSRREEQRAASSVIIDQIAQRQAERIREQELKEQEAQAMLQRIREMEEREDAERREKIAAGRRLLEQVRRDNEAQARAKILSKQEEIEEDARIAEYIKAKEAREAAAEAEQLRIKAEKEREVARLRALQEKVQDRQSAVDALRAKRYHEAKERAWRQQQLEEAQRREATRREMQQARQQQQQEKMERLLEQAMQEREEYQRTLEHQMSTVDAERHRAEEAKLARQQHREMLLAQMRERERAKKAARERFLREGTGLSGSTEAERIRLEAIRQQKLRELEAAGVPEKYHMELKRMKLLDAPFRGA